MAYPWPSLGGFVFQRHESPASWASDSGWALTPSYSRQRPLGSATDVISTLAIGSAERSFEVLLSPDRYKALEMMLNTKALFTDWTRPIPESRMAFLSELTPVENVIVSKSQPQSLPGNTNGFTSPKKTQRKIRTRIVLVSA